MSEKGPDKETQFRLTCSSVTHLEGVMDANKDLKGGITVHGVGINNLRFADDIDLIGASSSSLLEAAQLLYEQGKRSGLVINKAKTQTMVFGNDNIYQPVKIDDYPLKNVTWFSYLGSVFTYDNDCSQDYGQESVKLQK